MKLFQARIVTANVANLTRFYHEITGVTPIGGEDYVEFEMVGGGLAISSKRSIDAFGAGAASPGSNRSMILDFQVEDVDRERLRLADIVHEFVLDNQPAVGQSLDAFPRSRWQPHQHLRPHR